MPEVVQLPCRKVPGEKERAIHCSHFIPCDNFRYR
uniref:Uncharacterized protein n=1 Tax=Arundo donax TaxID=35708 RepID=A0A0A9E452_ARUDO